MTTAGAAVFVAQAVLTIAFQPALAAGARGDAPEHLPVKCRLHHAV